MACSKLSQTNQTTGQIEVDDMAFIYDTFSFYTDAGLVKRLAPAFITCGKALLEFLEKRGDVVAEMTDKDFRREMEWFDREDCSFVAEAEFFVQSYYWMPKEKLRRRLLTIAAIIRSGFRLVKPDYWLRMTQGGIRLNITANEREMFYRMFTVYIERSREIASCETEVTRLYDYEAQALFSIGVEHQVPESVSSFLSTVENLISQHLTPLSTGAAITRAVRKILFKVAQYWMTKEEYKYYYIASACLELITDYCDAAVYEYLLQTYRSLRDICLGQEDGADVAQSAKDLGSESVVALLGAATTGALSVGSEMPKSRWFKCVKAFGDLGKSISGLESLYDWIAKIGQKFIKLITAFVTGEDPEEAEIKRLVDDYVWFGTEFARLNSLEEVEKAKRNPINAAAYRHAVNIAMRIESRMLDLKLSNVKITDLRTRVQRLKVLYEEVANSGIYSAGSRIEPVVLYLHGEPNCGKSFVVQYIASAYLKSVGIQTDDPWKFMYKYNPTDEFMSGYTGQPIFVMDDLGQVLDQRSLPNPEIMTTIFASNVAPMPLNMAALSDKGTSYFTSPLIIMTSNRPKPYVVSITEPDAFYRRISPFHFCVRPAAPFAKQAGNKICLDTSKLRGVMLEVFEFEATECLKGYSVAPVGSKYNFTGFMNFLFQEVDKKIKNNKMVHDTFKALDFAALCERLPPVVTAPTVTTNVQTHASNNVQNAPVSFAFPVNESDLPSVRFQQTPRQSLEGAQPEYEAQVFGGLASKIKGFIRAEPEDMGFQEDLTEYCEEIFAYFRDNTLTEEVASHYLTDETDVEEFLSLLRGNRELGLSIFVNNHRSEVAQMVAFCRDEGKSLAFCIKQALATNMKNPLRLFLIGLSGALAAWLTYKAISTTARKLYDVSLKVGRSDTWKIGIPQTPEQIECLATCMAAVKRGTQKDREWFVFFMSTELIQELLSVAMDDPEWAEFLSDFPLEEELRIRESRAIKGASAEVKKMAQAAKTCKPVDLATVAETYSGLTIKGRNLENYNGVVIKPSKLENYNGVVIKPNKLENYSGLVIKPTKLERSDECVFPDDAGYVNITKVIAQMVPNLTDRSHSILPADGKPYKHSHFCEVCGGVFTHTHKRKFDPDEAIKYPHICRDCKAKGKTIPMKSESLEAQSEDDIGLTQIQFRILSNMYSIFVDENTKERPKGNPALQGIFIRGQIMLVPSHLRNVVTAGKYYKLVGGNDTMLIFPCDSVKWYPLYDNQGDQLECWLMECPASVHSHRDITNLIATKEDHVARESGKANLVSLVYNSQGRSYAALQFTKFDVQTGVYVGGLSKDRETERINGYRYLIPTKGGFCGSILFECSRYRTRRFIGMHVAGNVGANTGFSERIQYDWVMEGLSRTSFIAQIAMPPSDEDDLVNDEITVDGEGMRALTFDAAPAIIEVEGLAPIGRAKAVRSPTETNYIPSIFHGLVAPVTQKPAMLVPTNGIDPVLKGLKKLTGHNLYIDPDLLDDVVSSIKGEMIENTNKELCRVFDLEVACYGDSAISQYLTGVNRKTSPGFPYIFNAKGPGKTTWIGPADKPWIDPNLRADVFKRIEAAKKGFRTWTIYVTTTKDETRPIPKVDEGKTRLFAVGPVDHTLASKMYFMGFCAHVMENRIYNEIGLGIDVHSREWNDLAIFFKDKERMIAGDFENFDGSLCRQVLQAVGDIIISWYDIGSQTDEDRRIRQVLYNEVINAYHNCRGSVFQSTHSQTSGNILTTVINCLFLKIVMRLAFVKAGGSLPDFKKYVSLCTYGDDNIMSVSKAAPPDFNQRGLTKILAQFGLTYTDEAKSGREFDFRPLTEVEFLKRSFRYSEEYGRWVGPLRLDVLTNMMDWQKKKLDPEEQMRTNFEVLQKELTYHPVEKAELLTKYEELFRKAVIPVEVRNRQRLILDLIQGTYRVTTGVNEEQRSEYIPEAVIGDELDY
jgi:hypothetical protein